MRSHLSQTVKNVLRKGRSNRSRRPSSFRELGEEYGDGDSTTRSYNEDSSAHRLHRGRRSSDSENSNSYRRESSVISRFRGRSRGHQRLQPADSQSQIEPNRRHRSLWHHNSQRATVSAIPAWESKDVDDRRTGSQSPREFVPKSAVSTTASTEYAYYPSYQSASPKATPTAGARRTIQPGTRHVQEGGSPPPSSRFASSSPNRHPQHQARLNVEISPEQSARVYRNSPPDPRSAPRSAISVRPPPQETEYRRTEEADTPRSRMDEDPGGYNAVGRRVQPAGQAAIQTSRKATRQTSQSGSAYQSAQDYPATGIDLFARNLSAYTRFGTPTDLTKFFFPEEWIPSRFRSIRKIASAIHGEVRCARDQLDGNKEVVVKVIRNSAVRPREPGELENPLVEIGAMTYLHSNRAVYPVDLVAKMLGVYQDNKYTYLVSEHCSGGELFREVVARKCFHERLVKAVALQLALALLSLHKNGICHRDVSLENTLLAGDRTIRLIDFGQAECIYNADGSERWLTGSAGKDYYRAPEMTRGPYLGRPVDVFALGVEVFIMAIGSPPWNEATLNDARYRSLTSRVDALDIAFRKWGKRGMLSNAFVDLVSGIFCADPKDRPTIEELLLHPWFSHDLGIWQWVANRGHSVTIAQQKERVFAYLRDVDPRGKFFYRPCGSAVSTYSALSTNNLNGVRDLGGSGTPVAHDRAAAARHRRPHA